MSIFSEKIAGLDIGDGYIAASRVRYDHTGQPEITHAGWVDCSAAASAKETAAQIKKLWSWYGITARTVCSCVRNRSLVVKPFRYGNISHDELPSSLKLEAESMLQLPSDRIHMDWSMMNGSSNGTSNGSDIQQGFMVAVPDHEIEQHLEILRMAGLYPVSLDIGCTALSSVYRACRHRNEHDEAVCVMGVSQTAADLSIICNDHEVFPRTFFARTDRWENAVDYLVQNIRDHLRYFQVRWKERPVKRIILTGDIHRRDDLVQLLREKSGLKIDLWNPIEEMNLTDAVSRKLGSRQEESTILAAAVGLALNTTHHE